MKNRPLILSPKARANIRAVIDYATANPLDKQTMLRIKARTLPPPGDNPKHTAHIEMGYRCVLTHEWQPIGLSRHLSMRISGEGHAPGPAAVAALMGEFGFTCTPQTADHLWIEEIDNKRKGIIHVLQKL